LTQYSRRVWTQEQGLPQDRVRAIAQTTDGYLWLGTDEGLARWNGYEFTIIDKAGGNLPANSIQTLAAAPDGSLWIGTNGGLVWMRGGRFRTYTTRDGLADNRINKVLVDRNGVVWALAGAVSRLENGRFATLDSASPGAARVACEDRSGGLLIAGLGGVVRISGGKATEIAPASALNGSATTSILQDRRGNLWIGGSQGLLEVTPEGARRWYGPREGLRNPFVRALLEDRDGSVWAGSDGGLVRIENGKVGPPEQREGDIVGSLFEDREGNVWIGSSHGLTRLRDDLYTSYGLAEALPSDQPNAVHQDRAGRIWVGFHDAGLMQFAPERRLLQASDGLPPSEVFSIRATRAGGLLVSTSLGLFREAGGRFEKIARPDEPGRAAVFDALEDSAGRIWAGSGAGLEELRGGQARNVIVGGTLFGYAVVALLETRDGAVWAGTYGRGLWRLKGGEKRLFTTADGLAGDDIRALHQDADGAVWIGTFGGGLSSYRDGKFQNFTSRDGLLSDNVASIVGDGDWLWLGTTRGLCRVSRKQLNERAANRRGALTPEYYDMDDGLRSAQCAAYPLGAGGTRSSDGRLWFTTSRGLAVLSPTARKLPGVAPLLHIEHMTADGRDVDPAAPVRLEPGSGRVQVRYTGVYLSAPERVEYSYKLEGLDADWVRAGNRRTINYNSLRHGRYRFDLRAVAPGGEAAEASFDFELLPHYYETAWFRLLAVAALAAAVFGMYRLRLRRIGDRFALVLRERARLAREIHDTLAQGFVGISSQLDAVSMCMPEGASAARQYLDLARRMARHSLTEARRSVMDLRAGALENQDLRAALESGALAWAAGTGVEIEVSASGPREPLAGETEQHLLRIAQEAVANALKHAGAKRIRIELTADGGSVRLRITDNGRGFDQQSAFSSTSAHFGLLGMRERAERLGGKMRLASQPGEGTEVEVTAPLS
jgi:signal transduction histidine kinase/ligand-binding sensor domain-containing protein